MMSLYTLALVIAGQTAYTTLSLISIAIILWYLSNKPERQIEDNELV